MVCKECNQELGKQLEFYLGKATYEGIMRYDFNIKTPEDLKGKPYRSNVAIRVDEGKLKGAYATRAFNFKLNKIIILPFPQIGFKKRGVEEYDFYPLWEIPSKEELDEAVHDIDNLKGVIILGCKLEDAKKRLDKRGFNIKFNDDYYDHTNKSNEDIRCKTEWSINETVKRGIAKIAFNYLTKCHGAEFVLNKKFDDVRKFIRWADKPNHPIFEMDDKPILADEPQDGKSRLGHIITLNWASDDNSIIAQVSLFNMIRYRISLAKDFTMLHRPFNIARGHFFNLWSRDILPLTNVDPRIIVV
jgi:hypothetical protein